VETSKKPRSWLARTFQPTATFFEIHADDPLVYKYVYSIHKMVKTVLQEIKNENGDITSVLYFCDDCGGKLYDSMMCSEDNEYCSACLAVLSEEETAQFKKHWIPEESDE